MCLLPYRLKQIRSSNSLTYKPKPTLSLNSNPALVLAAPGQDEAHNASFYNDKQDQDHSNQNPNCGSYNEAKVGAAACKWTHQGAHAD
jgi:hypothetical protein